MLFNSFPFIFFYLPLALAGFYLVARIDHRLAGGWLVIASLVFYGYWKLSFLPVLLVSIGFNFAVSRLLGVTAARPRLQSFLLACGIAVNLLGLVYYKYLFAVCNLLREAEVADVPFSEVILPLGISFFTFTQIGYLVDVKQGVAKVRGLLTYLLFVTFFPHLIAGPILHNREMMPQFADPKTYSFRADNIIVGLTIFCIGLAKKTLLADPLSADVAAGFGAAHTVGAWVAWQTVIAYSLQLYFDFSGYCDMAIGLARMFNVRFPANFNSPYKSTTVIEYWQRFHITLTRFITMYIFSPMALWVARRRSSPGGRRTGRTPRLSEFAAGVAAPTMITMALAGIWHGAGLQYLIFGLLHGSYIVVNHVARTYFPGGAERDRRSALASGAIRAAKVAAVYVAVLVAFAFFRAASTGAALDLLSGMAGLRGLGPLGSLSTLGSLAILLAIVWIAPNTQQIMKDYEPTLGRVSSGSLLSYSWRPSPGWAYAFGALAAVGILAVGGSTEFLYFQF